jgi:hypothetical protein
MYCYTGSLVYLKSLCNMLVLVILGVFLILGLMFGGNETPSKLPSFTKEEATRYYQNIRNKKH